MRLSLILFALLAATPVFANEMPTPPAPPPSFHAIDMTQTLTNIEGEPFKDPTDPAKTKDLTLGTAIGLSLCGDREEDRKEDALAKAKRCYLGIGLLRNTAAVLTATETAQIEGRIGNWSPAVIVRIIQLIDPPQLQKP